MGTTEALGALAIAPDGIWVAWSSYLSNDGTEKITVANAVTGEQQIIVGPTTGLRTAVPSSDGQLAAVEDVNGVVRIMDLASGSTLAQLEGRTTDGALVGFSADLATLIFNEENNLRAVDWRTGTVAASLPGVQSLPPAAQAFMNDGFDGCGVGFTPFASFSADGSTAVVGSSCSRPWQEGVNPHSQLYDVASGNLVQTLPGGWSLLSSAGTILAFGAVLWCR